MINIEKGGRINLSKENPNLKKIRAGLGWDANSSGGNEFDLDVSVFVCKPDAAGNPKLLADAYMVFYNQTESPDHAVKHSGDNRTGSGDGDDESIFVDLTKINPLATELSFVVTIHKANERGQSFGQVKNSYIKLYNDETGEEVMKYELEDDFSGVTAVHFGSLYKREGNWMFKAIGMGFKKGLEDFVRIYGADC